MSSVLCLPGLTGAILMFQRKPAKRRTIPAYVGSDGQPYKWLGV